MEDISLKINNLQNKIEKLVKLHTELRVSYQNLKDENKILQREIKDLSSKIEESEHQIYHQPEPDHQKVLVKARINELVKEIDKCLNLLNT